MLKITHIIKNYYNSSNEKNNSNITIENTLTDKEKKQLNVFNYMPIYIENYKTLQKNNHNYTKKDILWATYNDLKLKLELEKDIYMLPIVFEQMSIICYEDKKNAQSLELFLSSIYLLVYDYDVHDELDLIKRHYNKRRKEYLIKLINNTEVSIDKFIDIFINSINKNIPQYYNENKIIYIANRLIKTTI